MSFAPISRDSKKLRAGEGEREYVQMKEGTGLVIGYFPRQGGGVRVAAIADDAPEIEAIFPARAIDEAHILYMEATELLRSRAQIGQDRAAIRKAVETLFGLFRGEKMSSSDHAAPASSRAIGEFAPNPGKSLEIDVDGISYLRLPIKTRLIGVEDADLMPLIDEYVRPHLKKGDMIFVSEKALTITQGRVVDMSDIHPGRLARFLSRRVGNNYGSSDFHGFGHGTDLAMQLFLDEAGYSRVFFAAAVSAITRPFGIRGLFYSICGKRAKSIDCPMSFLILEYAHSAKLAPNDPSRVARTIQKRTGSEAVILDANYRGAFSLGKSTRRISEKFIGKLFKDNPLGQSDEMTPFCIVRRGGSQKLLE